MFSSDYVDINKLEIHNLEVISADMVAILVHLNQFVMDFSLYKFNVEITQFVNAMLNLEEYGQLRFCWPPVQISVPSSGLGEQILHEVGLDQQCIMLLFIH
ncbi:unnamed protein product [Allacma fusca]|uniref:Uncharacterized protein n=1 Tax=Allacma fusca TaxID=39272 RepID=A0A8J2J847_9HEXA|nr:unnamed protein product [Allacma fusca]